MGSHGHDRLAERLWRRWWRRWWQCADLARPSPCSRPPMQRSSGCCNAWGRVFFASVPTAGRQVIYGINMANNTPANAAAEAGYRAPHLGTALLAWEVGNEPDRHRSNGERAVPGRVQQLLQRRSGPCQQCIRHRLVAAGLSVHLCHQRLHRHEPARQGPWQRRHPNRRQQRRRCCGPPRVPRHADVQPGSHRSDSARRAEPSG